MAKKRMFFYRLDAARFLAEVTNSPSDKDLAKFIRQLAVDLVTGMPTSPLAEDMIAEASDYVEKKRSAGSAGGKQRSSNAKAMLEQRLSKGQANNNSSNIKTKPKGADAPIDYPDWLPVEQWNEYKAMRNKINKPLTGYAEKLRLKDLTKLKDDGFDPVEVLNQSIVHNWQDLYKVKKEDPEKEDWRNTYLLGY